VVGPTQTPLPHNTQHSQQTDIHAPRWYSNPQPQQARGRRPYALDRAGIGTGFEVFNAFIFRVKGSNKNDLDCYSKYLDNAIPRYVESCLTGLGFRSQKKGIFNNTAVIASELTI